MAYLRAMAALAAVALVGRVVEATEIELPPCIPEFQPFLYSGCFKGDKLLSMRSSTDQQDMTTEECMSVCKGNGYRYAGLVYHGVCYCGQTVSGLQVDDSECSFPCSGDPSQLCGGDDRGRIYQDPTFLPHEEATIEDYDPLGCWTDDSSQGRALSYQQDVDGSSLTTEKCLQKCRDGGFPFAGTEYGGECFCGVVIGNGTYSAPDSECHMPCNGNAGEKCGGPGRLNLYVADELLSLQPCGYEPPPVSSEPPTTITTPPTTTPTTPPTTTSSLCVSTTTIPSKCEYKCGKWCSNPIPDFNDKKKCHEAWSHCALQVASCFKHAGWPDSLNCFDFGEWCNGVNKYCTGTHSGWSKPGFCKKNPPKQPQPPTTSTYTTTCVSTAKPSTSTSTSTTQVPIPTPTGICVQPDKDYGFGKGKPVAGIELPIVTCNDLKDQFNNFPWKLYNQPNSRNCKAFQGPKVPSVCKEACKEQFEDCEDVYAQTCKDKRRRFFNIFDFISQPKQVKGWNDTKKEADNKCRKQYDDCKAANEKVKWDHKCKKYGVF